MGRLTGGEEDNLGECGETVAVAMYRRVRTEGGGAERTRPVGAVRALCIS
jgi:hypothetical protein